MNIDHIIAYEQGDLDAETTLAMFAEGIRSGMVWKLQGHYGRTAQHLIESGYITREGEITDAGHDAVAA